MPPYNIKLMKLVNIEFNFKINVMSGIANGNWYDGASFFDLQATF